MFNTEKKFEVENTLIIYAEDKIHLPADKIYEAGTLAPYMDRISKCHIYFIGLMPKINLVNVTSDDQTMFYHLRFLNKEHIVPYKIPEGWSLFSENGLFFLANSDGEEL